MTKSASDGQCLRALELFEELTGKGMMKPYRAYDEISRRLQKENWPENERITAYDGRRDSGGIRRMVEREKRRRRQRMKCSVLRTQRVDERVAVVTPPVDRKGTWVWASQVARELADYTGRRAGSFEFAWAHTSSRDLRIGTVSAERFFYQSRGDVPASGTIVVDLVALE